METHISTKLVMPGLVPGIHVLAALKKDVDGRDEPGHDEKANHFQMVRKRLKNTACIFGHTFQDEDLNPHGEERGKAARLEPSGIDVRP